MDEQFLHRLKVRDNEAITVLVDAYRDRVYSIGYRVAVSKDEALVLTGTVFRKFLEHLYGIRKINDVENRIEREILDTVLDYLSREYQVSFFRRVIDLFYRTKPRALERLAREEVRDILHRAVIRLPLTERKSVVLKYYHGLNTKQIRSILQLKEGQVKQYLLNAKRRLTRTLRKEIQ